MRSAATRGGATARAPRALLTALCLVAALGAGCFRTQYVELQPPGAPLSRGVEREPREPEVGWQHFFLYGWVPSTRVVRANDRCGGAEGVHAIHTSRSFPNSLVSAFTSPIYVPWTGQVVCR